MNTEFKFEALYCVAAIVSLLIVIIGIVLMQFMHDKPAKNEGTINESTTSGITFVCKQGYVFATRGNHILIQVFETNENGGMRPMQCTISKNSHIVHPDQG